MATTKERILITLAPSTAKALRARAKSEKTPRATIAAQFVEWGLLDAPTVELPAKGAIRALRAIRAYERERHTGNLKELNSLVDLV